MNLLRLTKWMFFIAIVATFLPLHAAAAQESPTATLVAPAVGADPESPDDVRLFNEYIAITVNATAENTGRFAVQTTGGDPDRASDDDSPLIYKVPGQSPWTSYATLRIDGIDYVFGGNPTERAGRAGLFGEQVEPPYVADDSRIDTVYQIGPIRALQSLGIIRSSTTGLLDTARIEYQLTNTSGESANVGLRLMLDTMLGENDGAPFRVGEFAIVSDTVFQGDDIPQFWQAFDSLSDPRVTSQGTLRDQDVTVPDRVYFSNWGALADGLWDFTFEPGRDFTRLGEFELDSATAMYWDPRPLGPGESRSYVVHYGLGGISVSPGELSIGVTSPATVSGDPERSVTFPIVAYIQNTGIGDARQVAARLDLPAGLKPAPGEALERQLGNLPSGRTAQVTWRVQVDPGVDGEFRYTVGVNAINAEPNQVSRLVDIVAPARLQIDIENREAALAIRNKRWDLPHRVVARVSNLGGGIAEDVVVRFDSPLLEVADGDTSVKPVGRLAPGESVQVTWHIRPQTVSASPGQIYLGNQPYSVVGSIGSAAEEYRAHGFLDVPLLESEVQVSPVGSGPIRPGDFFLVRIDAQNLRRFFGAELVISYDASSLRFIHAEPGTIFVGPTAADGRPERLAWNAPATMVGPGDIGAVSLAGKREGAHRPTLYWATDVIATLHFMALEPGEHPIAIERAHIFDENGDRVQVDIVSGSVTVSDE